jgi:response regulator of citrate/malate metabolism
MTKVLIVEDDPMVAQINKNYVSSVDGFQVIGIAKNEIEAISYIKKRVVDLVILDIYLPKGDGISILKEVRRIQAKCDVIMVTASAEVEKIDEALKYGVIDYLIKPFEYERLKKSLENYQSRQYTLSKDNKISQSDIDRLLISRINLPDETIQKGLNRLTLKRVISVIEKKADKFLSVEELSEELGLTKATVRRYMDYLDRIGYVIQEIEYGSVGRPLYLYKKMKK